MACDCEVCTWQPPRGPARCVAALPAPGPAGASTAVVKCLNPPENDPPRPPLKPAPPRADSSGGSSGVSLPLVLLAVLIGLLAALVLQLSSWDGPGGASASAQHYIVQRQPAPAASYCAAPAPTCRPPTCQLSTCRQKRAPVAESAPPPAPPPPPPPVEECVPEPEPEVVDECEAEVEEEEEDECAGFEDEA